MAILCFDQCQIKCSYLMGHKIIFIFHRPFFWTSCVTVFPKPEFSDFTVNGSGLSMHPRYWKYASLCWSNLYIMALLPGAMSTAHAQLCLVGLKLEMFSWKATSHKDQQPGRQTNFLDLWDSVFHGNT